MISITALVAALVSQISMRLDKLIGYSLLIKICMIIYPAALIISSFVTDIYLFAFLYSAVLGIGAGLSMIPITYMLYKHYGEKSSGNVTGILLGFFGIFTVFYIMIATLIVNPDNI